MGHSVYTNVTHFYLAMLCIAQTMQLQGACLSVSACLKDRQLQIQYQIHDLILYQNCLKYCQNSFIS